MLQRDNLTNGVFKVILAIWIRFQGNLARTTKFELKMNPVIFAAGIENEGHWAWPSGSLWPFRIKKRHSTSLSYTDLGRPKRALVEYSEIVIGVGISTKLAWVYMWVCIRVCALWLDCLDNNINISYMGVYVGHIAITIGTKDRW